MRRGVRACVGLSVSLALSTVYVGQPSRNMRRQHFVALRSSAMPALWRLGGRPSWQRGRRRHRKQGHDGLAVAGRTIGDRQARGSSRTIIALFCVFSPTPAPRPPHPHCPHSSIPPSGFLYWFSSFSSSDSARPAAAFIHTCRQISGTECARCRPSPLRQRVLLLGAASGICGEGAMTGGVGVPNSVRHPC